MVIQKFEDVVGWQKSRILVSSIYLTFKGCKDFSFKNQIERAAVSVMNNIAEGFERRSDKAFSNFLFIAKGSCAEVKSMLYIASDLGYIDSEQTRKLQDQASEIARILSGLIKSL